MLKGRSSVEGAPDIPLKSLPAINVKGTAVLIPCLYLTGRGASRSITLLTTRRVETVERRRLKRLRIQCGRTIEPGERGGL